MMIVIPNKCHYKTYLNASRAPLNEINKLSFAYSLQTIMNLLKALGNITRP